MSHVYVFRRREFDRTGCFLAPRRSGSDIVVGRVQKPMAGNCFRRFWWWLPIVILSGCFPSAVKADRLSCTSIYPPETARDELSPSDADVIIFLGEKCDGEINVTEIQDHLEHASDLAGELSISVMSRSREYLVSDFFFCFGDITYLITGRYRALRVLHILYHCDTVYWKTTV